MHYFNIKLFSYSTVVFLLLLAFGHFWLSAFGVALCFYNVIFFVQILGSTIPIMEFMVLMASLQWILGPFFDYRLEVDHIKYFMYVSEEKYMTLAVPATFCFQLAIFYNLNNVDMESVYEKLTQKLEKYKEVPYFLVIIGLISPYLYYEVPISISFIFYLTGNLKFVGVLYLFFKGKGANNWLFWVIMSLTFLNSLQKGLFHDFILWSIIMFGFIEVRFKWGLKKRIMIMLVGFIFTIIIQTVKMEFREKINMLGGEGDELSVFVNLISTEMGNQSDFFSPENLDELNIRLNQGWIISAVMSNIPDFEPFGEGESIGYAFAGALLPRFLAPEKKMAGGRENFRKFTGLEIEDHTSMGISILGEAYGNFGIFGSYIFMALWGIFISILFRLLIYYSTVFPTFILWIPIIFLHALKAETELVVVLNHLVKSTILFVGIFSFFNEILRKPI